ncbi:MAG: hypothetical protein ACOYBE_12575 [Blautia sp.]|jgi:hypothetical protein
MQYQNPNGNPQNGSSHNAGGPGQDTNSESSQANNDWMNNPKLQGMDKSKLEMLQNLADQGSQKNKSDLMPFLMATASQGKAGGLSFNSNEISTIIEVIKMGKSPQEAARLDKIVNIMKMMQK